MGLPAAWQTLEVTAPAPHVLVGADNRLKGIAAFNEKRKP
jgi:hypothetical protein